MQKEELVLFPMIRAGHPMVSVPIAAMQAEHVDHGQSLEELRRSHMTCSRPMAPAAPGGRFIPACISFPIDLIDHIHIENNILFPPFLG